jgi:hypothetical protein
MWTDGNMLLRTGVNRKLCRLEESVAVVDDDDEMMR